MLINQRAMGTKLLFLAFHIENILLPLRSLKKVTDKLSLGFCSASALNRSDVTNDPRRFAANLRSRPNRQWVKMEK